MGDLIAIALLGLQYIVMVLVLNTWLPTRFSLSVIVACFLIIVCAGLFIWHRASPPHHPRRWATFTVYTVVLGIAFFGFDFVLAFANGQADPFHYPGGLLGLPLTFSICPGGTMICLAGLARSLYLYRRFEQSPK